MQRTRLLSGRDDVVYLDTEQPRVCIRGPEDRSTPDLGYPWLPEDEVFPFFERRAAAQDLRDSSDFDPDDARARISAQLNTLRDHRIQYVVLGAFGCGAFRNPAHRVAQIYREEIIACKQDFAVIAFAIFAPGYGGQLHAIRGGFSSRSREDHDGLEPVSKAVAMRGCPSGTMVTDRERPPSQRLSFRRVDL